MANEITYKQIETANKGLTTQDIKGKDYIPVNQRIKAFRMVYPTGYIVTDIINNENGVVTMRSECGYYSEDGTKMVLGSGMAFELQNSSYINKTSYIENCESSAVGRALGMCGFGIDASIASAEEVANAQLQQAQTTIKPDQPKKAKPQTQTQEEAAYICANCGNTFHDSKMAKATFDRFGKYICPECIEAKRRETKKA